MKAANVKEIACVGEIQESYALLSIITNVVPFPSPYHPDAIPFCYNSTDRSTATS